MNKKEYENKRSLLIEEAEELINSGKFKEFNEKKAEIESLDNEFERIGIEQANLNALKDEKGLKNSLFSGGKKFKMFENDTRKIILNSSDRWSDNIEVPKEQVNLDFGKIIKGAVTGNWDNAFNEKNSVTTTTTGILIPQVLSAQIIDLARDKSLFASANVPVIPMETDNLRIAKLAKDPVFKFKEEGREGENVSFELESVELKSKTVYGYAYVSMESIKSSANLDVIIRNAFSSAIAQAIDKTMLYGQLNTFKNKRTYSEFAPSGIMNDVNINNISATEESGYDDIIKAIATIKKVNGIPNTLAISSATEEKLNLLKDKNGQYLEQPKPIQLLNQIVTNQLENTDILVFDSNSMIIGMQDNIQIKVFDNDTECIKKGLVGFRIHAMLDCVVTQPKNICKITG